MERDKAMASSGINPRIKVREGSAVWRQIGGETVLLDLDSSMYLGINDAGSTLWPVMVRGTDRSELIELLRSTYDIDDARAAADVDAFVTACREHDLLEP
jgi:hypothetical protein